MIYFILGIISTLFFIKLIFILNIFFRFLPRRQLYKLSTWQAWFSYIKWRLETYGVYYPNGKFHWDIAYKMIISLPSYIKWIRRMDSL